MSWCGLVIYDWKTLPVSGGDLRRFWIVDWKNVGTFWSLKKKAGYSLQKYTKKHFKSIFKTENVIWPLKISCSTYQSASFFRWNQQFRKSGRSRRSQHWSEIDGQQQLHGSLFCSKKCLLHPTACCRYQILIIQAWQIMEYGRSKDDSSPTIIMVDTNRFNMLVEKNWF